MGIKLKTASFAAVGKMISVLLVCLGVFAGRVDGASCNFSSAPAYIVKTITTGGGKVIDPNAIGNNDRSNYEFPFWAACDNNPVVTINFVANDGSELTSVKVNGTPRPDLVSAGTHTIRDVTRSYNIEVTFSTSQTPPPPSTFNITVSMNKGGDNKWYGTPAANGASAAPGTFEVTSGGSFPVYFKALDGYTLSDVKVNGSSDQAALAAKGKTFTNVTSDQSIEAVFTGGPVTPSKHKIYVGKTAGGTVLPTNNSIPSVYYEVENGEDITFVFSTNPGYDLTEVKINGVINPDALTAGGYTFHNVTGDSTISVVFTDDSSPIKLEKSSKLFGIRFTPQNIVTGGKAQMSVNLPNGEKTAETRFTIYDNVGNVISVSTVFGDKKSEWDLTNSSGRIVANGAYLVIAEVKEKNGKVYAYSAKLVVKR